MHALLEWIGLMAVVFITSFAVSWAFTKGRRRPVRIALVPDQKLRLIAPGGAYRSRFLRNSADGLVVQAPLQRDVYVPLRVGTEIVVQAPSEEGLSTFRCNVLRRSVEHHEYVLSLPERVRTSERRCEPRLKPGSNQVARANEQPAYVINVSAGGAKILSLVPFSPGDFVSLELAEFEGLATGFALETSSSVWDGRPATEVRICFDEPFAGLRRPTRFTKLSLAR